VELAWVLDNDTPDLPTLVLLNGSVFNLDQWGNMLKGGWSNGPYRILRLDYADTGSSGRRTGPVGLRALGQELSDLLGALNIDQAHFYGISQGTMVLQALAVVDPDRILSACGYGWFNGNYSDYAATKGRIESRVAALKGFQDIWEEPLTRPHFERLWTEMYRQALFNATWAELSLFGKLKDWGARRLLFPLLAPTPIGRIYDWFSYCVDGLFDDLSWLQPGLEKLSRVPTLIQHAVDDATLEIGMARELHQAIPGSRLIEYPAPYTHISAAFDKSHARQVVSDHLAFLSK
jgi:pimeloyl-ACP methyl ester carboxylesterase